MHYGHYSVRIHLAHVTLGAASRFRAFLVSRTSALRNTLLGLEAVCSPDGAWLRYWHVVSYRPAVVARESAQRDEHGFRKGGPNAKVRFGGRRPVPSF